jgi:15-cis-phytoene desaturase
VRAWAQDELSVLEFMRKYGMPDRINQEVFISMAKALDFIDPDKLSMTVVLTAMNRFLNEDDGLQMAFLDGNQPDRVCAPIKAHVEARGGEVRLNAPVKEILTNDDGTVAGLQMVSGEVLTGFDTYVSAMPVDVLKRLVPTRWSTMPYFRQFDELEGIPVVRAAVPHTTTARWLRTGGSFCCRDSPSERLRGMVCADQHSHVV